MPHEILGVGPHELLGVAPWVVISAVVTWATTAYTHRQKRKEQVIDHADRLEVHRDELTFQLLQNARLEMASARIEVEDLRDEVRKLRSMENHFFHFQQSLDHLEALLFPGSPEERAVAERNAQAFLTRMRRLNEAKGTLANEAQRAASGLTVLERNEAELAQRHADESKDSKNVD